MRGARVTRHLVRPGVRVARGVAARLARKAGHARTLALLAVWAMLVTGCGAIPAGRPTTAGGPTLVPLAWHPAAATIASGAFGSVLDLEIAQSDGNAAYACTLVGTATFAIWATSDRADHWARAAALPDPPPPPADTQPACALSVDAGDPRTVVASVYWQIARQGPDLASLATYVTQDGGKSWRRLNRGDPGAPGQIATYRGTTYAVSAGLWASADGLRTWRRVDGDVRAAGDLIMDFWLDPHSGAILAQTWPLAGDPAALWKTGDGGARWARLPWSISTNLAARAFAPGGLWHICGLSQVIAGQIAGPNQLTCSADGGQTWTVEPTINVTWICHKCLPGGVPTKQIAPMELVGIDGDGAVLALADAPPPGAAPLPYYPDNSARTLFRLAHGTTVWRSLGIVPAGRMAYLPTTSGGVLWVVQDGPTIFTAEYA